MVTLNLFAEGVSKGAKECSVYAGIENGNLNNISFIPDWFDHLEKADNNSGYSKDFLQQHGGRVGKIVVKISDYMYDLGCSGTLIGEGYFLTAAHCAVPANVGVLFGYQKADLESSDDDEYYDDDDETNDNDSIAMEYPRVSLKGYLNNDDEYIRYDEDYSDIDVEYHDFDEHPAYFRIAGDNPYDGTVENGWTMSDDDNDKVDYAIYKLQINIQGSEPEKVEDPWPWRSVNNQDDERPEKPWRLLDNTNGKRGWARVNTAVQLPGSPLNIIGHPRVATIFDGQDTHHGIKVVNAGSVANGQYRGLSKKYEEDLLVFKEADIQTWHSGSPVIDYSGRLAGVVVWFGCAPGEAWDQIENNEVLQNQSAENYATPMWKICKVSQIIKNAAKDMDCNGIIDWIDFVTEIASKLRNIDVLGLRGNLINNFNVSPLASEVQNYRYDLTLDKVIPETKELPAYTYQVALPDNGDFFYVAIQNNEFSLFKNGFVLGEISNYPLLSGSSTLVKGDDIYLAGGALSVPHALLPGNEEYDLVPYQYITKISSDGQNGYTISMVADLPSDFEDIRIFSLGNDIYVSGNTNNSFVIYELVPNNQGENPYTLFPASDATQPVRKDYNLTAADGKIIVSGGATDYITSILGKTEDEYPPEFSVYGDIIMLEPAVSTSWVTVAENINDKIIMFSVTAIDDGKLVVVNPFITVGNSMQKFVLNLSDIPINNENIRVYFESHPVTFCLGESENTISGGIETSGTCVPFTHPFYNSFSAGTTVYSLAGKGNRLYAGTNDSIKIYDISDPNSPVLVSSFSTNNARVNDLEIEGNVLYAATSKGLYKLDASDPDELEQILFVSTGSTSQNEIELYDGKIYVGDDNGIKIRDKETLSVLLSANSGSVYDFAIENGEVAMFRSSFWNSGIQFRNAETLVETAYDYTSCNNVEVENFNGKLYLACDNYTYSFEANNGYIYFTQLSGDKRDLRENYTYSGYTYTPDGNYIRLSTNEEVPAICGNGIVEGDEICDGTPIDCTELDVSGNVSTNSGFVSGIAACNSTCDGYVLDNCTEGNGGDGW